MHWKPTVVVATFFVVSLLSAAAFAQSGPVELPDPMEDMGSQGEVSEEMAEVINELIPLQRHQRQFIEEYATERIEKKRDEMVEADPSTVREEMERLGKEALEAYPEEHPEQAEEIEAYEARLKALAEKSESSDDDSDESPEYSEEDLATIFDDVGGEIAVYGHEGRKVTQNDGFMVLQDDGYVIEFCYADKGCEDRSEAEGTMTAGMADSTTIHQSDPDKEVVGLRLHAKIHPHSAATVSFSIATGETSDAFGNPFEIEDTLLETENYEPGDTVTYDLGKTD